MLDSLSTVWELIQVCLILFGECLILEEAMTIPISEQIIFKTYLEKMLFCIEGKLSIT